MAWTMLAGPYRVVFWATTPMTGDDSLPREVGGAGRVRITGPLLRRPPRNLGLGGDERKHGCSCRVRSTPRYVLVTSSTKGHTAHASAGVATARLMSESRGSGH